MFDLADIWAARTGQKVRLVSANDHIHSRGSAHYEGLALDFQSSNDGGLSGFFREAGYHVLWRVPGHYGHVHVEHTDSSGSSPVALNARHAPRQGSTRRRAGARVGG